VGAVFLQFAQVPKGMIATLALARVTTVIHVRVNVEIWQRIEFSATESAPGDDSFTTHLRDVIKTVGSMNLQIFKAGRLELVAALAALALFVQAEPVRVRIMLLVHSMLYSMAHELIRIWALFAQEKQNAGPIIRKSPFDGDSMVLQDARPISLT
jgi:hypothetical protein